LISALFIRKIKSDPEADILLERLRLEGYKGLKNLTIERVYRLEGIDSAKAVQLVPVFCHPGFETASLQSTLKPEDGPLVEIGYQRAVTDPELPSILRAAGSLGVTDLAWARIYHRYQFSGVDAATAADIANRHLYNPQVQVILSGDETWDSIRPHGHTGPVERVSLQGLDDRALAALSDDRRLFLDAAQMRALSDIEISLGRPFTDAELEMFAQTWSDHCFHTTWKSLGLLKALSAATAEIAHPLVLSAFVDNAGVMAFYEGWALTVKGETHNSPTAVSPYGGIMTKHGGVIRDTLGCGLGAWPIGGSTVMGLGDPNLAWDGVPKGALHPKTILLQSVRGTADYVNPMGIPMMFPVYRFHRGYTGKCFALGHSVGLIPEKDAAQGRPRPGDLAVLIGGPTGRDGLHGATVSSSSMTHETADVDAAHVQIGHPIEERKFMEAIPELRDAGCLRAITDLGAAGLSSAAGEMGSETGVWINLAWIPLKTEGLMPWEIWISESQERMLLAVPPDRWAAAAGILDRYEVGKAVIGAFTTTRRCQVIHDSSMRPDPAAIPAGRPGAAGFAVDLPFSDLRKGCPLPEIRPLEPVGGAGTAPPPPIRTPEYWKAALEAVVSHLNCCDQSAAGTQFDSTVQGITVTGPYGGADGRMPEDVWISTPVRGRPFGAAAALSFAPFWGDADPAGAVKLAMAESIAKLIAAGVERTDIVLCDNFYTPRITPETAWRLKAMVDACCSLSRTFGTPFISGKDSSSGTFRNEDGSLIEVPPTLCVFAMGRLPDVMKRVAKPFRTPGNAILWIGPVSAELGGSVHWDARGHRGNRLPDPDPKALLAAWDALSVLRRREDIVSASAIGEGGLGRRLFEASLGSGFGCRVDTDALARASGGGEEAALFAESAGSVLVEVPAARAAVISGEFGAIPLGIVEKAPVLAVKIGTQEIKWEMRALADLWKRPFTEVVL
jgi:phosphoribosylformylglycinamidine synthase subunit PurSL